MFPISGSREHGPPAVNTKVENCPQFQQNRAELAKNRISDGQNETRTTERPLCGRRSPQNELRRHLRRRFVPFQTVKAGLQHSPKDKEVQTDT